MSRRGRASLVDREALPLGLNSLGKFCLWPSPSKHMLWVPLQLYAYESCRYKGAQNANDV